VCITVVPIINLFARGEGDRGGHVLRETTSRGLYGLVCPSHTSERSDPPMGWWLDLHQPPWSFGFDSQTRGTRENRAPPCVKVPGSSRVPAPPWVSSRSPDGWDQIPRWAGACTSHPGVLGSIPKREEPGKTGCHPVLKYRVPHGSQCVMGRLVHTGLGS